MKLLLTDDRCGDSMAHRYWRDCCAQESSACIANIATRMAVLETATHCFPVTINSGEEKPVSGESNSYVVSPLAAYSSYALVELQRLNRPLLTWPLALLVKTFGCLLRGARVDAIVQVNNWLLSTNLYPPQWQGDDARAMLDLLLAEFPHSAIGFRSLNESCNGQLIGKLEAVGFQRIPSRQVYLFDASAEVPAFTRHHNSQLDATLLKKSPYQRVNGCDFTETDFARAEFLYRLLYLDKYCRLNPQYTAAWLAAGQRNGWLELLGLRNEDGVLEGVVGWFATDTIITAPIVGYNTALPVSCGLYRMLTRLCLQRAHMQHKLLNFSSGAARFKRLRGGVASIEYSLVYTRHLSPLRRFAWRCLRALLMRIAVPLMRILEL